MNLYILTFDPHKTDAPSLHKAISNNTLITSWWHYLGSTYIIKSDSSVGTITDDILKNWPNQRFFMAKIDTTPGNRNGWLPKEAWEWIRNNV